MEADPAHGDAAWDAEEGRWWSIDPVDSDELLAELGEPLAHPELRKAFVDAFDDEWCQREPYRLSHGERLRHSWEAFSTYVKEQSRYLFLRTGRGSRPDDELIEPAEMLDEVQTAIANSGLVPRPTG